jgi:hypothetical protein
MDLDDFFRQPQMGLSENRLPPNPVVVVDYHIPEKVK